MDAREAEILTGRLIPPPKRIEFADGPVHHLRDGAGIVLRVGEAAGVAELAAELCRKYWDIAVSPVVEAVPEAETPAAEAYKIGIAETEISVTARGTRESLTPFAKLAQSEGRSNVSPVCSAWWIRLIAAVFSPEKLISYGFPSICAWGKP